MHSCQWSFLERDRYKLLRIHIVEPVSEWPISPPEDHMILIYSLLVPFIVVRCSQSCQVSEIR